MFYLRCQLGWSRTVSFMVMGFFFFKNQIIQKFHNNIKKIREEYPKISTGQRAGHFHCRHPNII